MADRVGYVVSFIINRNVISISLFSVIGILFDCWLILAIIILLCTFIVIMSISIN